MNDEDERIQQITVQNLKEQIDKDERLLILDVREKEEYQLCRIPGAKLIPLKEIPKRFTEINTSENIVVYCHSGIRSAQATLFLKKKGYSNVKNLIGGIDSWSINIDPDVARY